MNEDFPKMHAAVLSIGQNNSTHLSILPIKMGLNQQHFEYCSNWYCYHHIQTTLRKGRPLHPSIEDGASWSLYYTDFPQESKDCLFLLPFLIPQSVAFFIPGKWSHACNAKFWFCHRFNNQRSFCWSEVTACSDVSCESLLSFDEVCCIFVGARRKEDVI